MQKSPTGYDVLHDAGCNKSTAFTREEREKLGLRGLLPYRINDTETQEVRALENLRRKGYDIERYIFCLLYTSPSPRDATLARMPSSA